MSDLPELQHLLIEAAGRRSRRRRRMQGGRVAVLAAAAAAVALALPRVGGEDLEVPAVTPTPTPAAPATIADAYSVFRRPARAVDHVQLFGRVRGSDTRLVAQTAKTRVFLAVKGDQACVVIAPVGFAAAGQSCGATRLYLDGYVPHGSVGTPPSPTGFVFPDGVRSITLTLADGTRRSYPVATNGAAIDDLPARADRVDWVAPDGSPQHTDFKPGYSDLYSALKRPPMPGSDLPGLPGSRLILQANSTRAWLVPRGRAICLVVDVRGRQASVCRSLTMPIAQPIVVGMPGGPGGRVVVAAFADIISGFSVAPETGIARMTKSGGVLFWSDAGEPRTLRFTLAGGDSLHQDMPTGLRKFVLNAVAQDPKTLPDP